MTPHMPSVAVPGDRLGVMARNGRILGLSPGLIVWRFGFAPDSPEAAAFRLVAPMPLWVLASHLGRVVYTRVIEWAADPPLRLRMVMAAKL